MSPGSTVRPCRSIIFVFVARVATTALSVPTASTRPPPTTTACAIENAGSTVTILPSYRIMSGSAAISADENRERGDNLHDDGSYFTSEEIVHSGQ